MTEAQHGNKVHIHYTGKLTDGTVFDSSEGREPLEFELGAGQVIPGLDKAMRGMNVGDTKTVTVASEEAYGPHHPEGVHVVETAHASKIARPGSEIKRQFALCSARGINFGRRAPCPARCVAS